MAAKHVITIAVADLESLVADLRAVYVRAMAEGVDLMTHPPEFGRSKKRAASKFSRSALILRAIRYGAEASAAPAHRTPVMLTATAGITDAERLRAAMGTMAPIEVCRAAGLKDGASIRNVKRGVALAGKLLTWVVSVEGGGT